MDIGLTAIHTDELKKILRLLLQNKLIFPLKRTDLLLSGLNLMADRGDLLFGLEEKAVKAILIAVLAERKKASEKAKPQIQIKAQEE